MRPLFQILRKWSLAILAASVFVLLACHLSGDEKVEATISFNKMYDSLKQYDSVQITLIDKDGHTIDVVFHGKVSLPGDVEKRPTPHWDGGDVIVSVVGFKGGVIVYQVRTPFNGENGKKGEPIIFVDSGMGLSALITDLALLEGDSIALPKLTITPLNIADTSLIWTSSAPDVVLIGKGWMKAVHAGNSQVTAKLAINPSVTLTLKVTVFDPTKIPESVSLSADTLFLSAGGASGHLDLQFIPTAASKDVLWSVADPTVAEVSLEGSVKGIKPGVTLLRVRSSLKAAAADSAVLVISEPVKVESVAFKKDSTEIFVGGAAESLLVIVLPAKSNPEVEFTVSNPALIGLNNGRISGLAEGTATVTAKSKENPALTATLKVKVTVKQIIDTVKINKKAFTLFTGGETVALTASISPAVSIQKVQWRSGNAAVATVTEAGVATGVALGHTRIYAISQADSSKQDSAEVTVKTDAPVITVGRPDTTLSLGSVVTFHPVVAPQEYGVIVEYRWDVDGLPGWDDTALTVTDITAKFEAEKEYAVRFYVKDTEGNESIFTKKVSAVSGPVVNITSPLNGAYFTKPAIKVVWTIDGVVQTTENDMTLKDGANSILRTAKDAAGKSFPATITVYLDSNPPAKPTVRGAGGAATATPTWTWAPGGGGAGSYRISLDSESFAAVELKDTLFTAATALSEGAHTLYVQERDAAGNWSASGKAVTVIDLTGPGKPNVKLNVASPSNAHRPIWSWSTGGNGGSGLYQSKFDNADFSTGVKPAATDTTFTPGADLGEGAHTLYVRERDSLGNWSLPGNASVTIDTTAPGAPKVFGSTPTSTAPKWTWTSGGGGSGTFRYKVGGDPSASPENKDTTYVQPSLLSKTTYILNIQERDAVGNWSPVTTYSIYYDITKPTVSITAPLASGTYMTKSPTVDLAGTSSSPQGAGTIKSITYTVDGVAGSISTNMDAAGAWNIKALPLQNNKTIVVKIVATDVADNVGEASLSILMDNTAPTAPGFTTQPPAIVNKTDPRTTLQWIWGRTGDATDSFVVKLNGAEIARQVAAIYTSTNITDGDYQLEISEKDLTGNISGPTTSTKVSVDRVSPTSPAFSSQPPAIVNKADSRTTLVWNWGRTGAATDSFLVSLNGTVVARLTTTTYTVTPIPDGSYQLEIVEKDLAGNPSNPTTSNIVIVDKAAPATPAYSTQPPAIVNKSDSRTSLQWIWNRTGDATDSFLVSLNGSLVSRQTGTSYTASPISDGDYQIDVIEKDVNGNSSSAVTSTKVLVDRTSPTAPDLSQPATPRKTAQWTFSGGGGGNANFKCVLDGGSEFGCTSPYILSPTDGDHTLKVRETDAAGNLSTYSSTTVTIDLQKPVINLSNYFKMTTAQIFSTIPDFTGTATDDRQMRYVHAVVGPDSTLASGSNPWTVSPSMGSGTRTVTFVAEDVAGNTASVQITVTYEPTVIFVRKGAAAPGNGTSWETAYAELNSVLRSDKSFSGKQIWVAEGNYLPATSEGFLIHSDNSMYGGFASEGNNRSLAERDLTHNFTVLNPFTQESYVLSNLLDKGSGPDAYAQNITYADFEVDGGKFPVTFSNVKQGTLKGFSSHDDTQFIGLYIVNSTVDVSDTYIGHNLTSEGGIEVSGSTSKVRLRNTTVSSNTTGDGGGITLYGGSTCAGSGSSLSYNTRAEVVSYGGAWSREASVTMGDGGVSGTDDTIVGSCPAPF